MTLMEEKSAVPQRLVEPLRIVAGRARFLAWTRAIVKLVALIAGVWLLVALLMGTWLRVPAWIALPAVGLSWIAVLWGGFRILRPLFARRSTLAAAARLVDDALPDSEERISSAVELAQEDARFRGSPELVAVLTRQAEHHADTLEPEDVVSGRDVLRWMGGAVTLLLAWLVLLLVFTPNMLLGMQRFFQPWTASAALPPLRLEVTPGDAVRAQGTSLDVTVKVLPPEGLSLDTGERPIEGATLIQSFPGAPDIATPMPAMGRASERLFKLTLENLQQTFTYRIVAEGGREIGRGESQPFTVNVETRPAIADVEVIYDYPAYTAQPSRTQHSREGVIEGLVGSKIRILAHTTEPVKTALLSIADDGRGKPLTLDLKPVETPRTSADSREAVYAGEFVLATSTEYRIKLLSEAGRDNPDSQPRPIHARADTPPTITITLPDSRTAAPTVRPDDVVPMKFVATDDFGISRVDALVQVDDRPAVELPVTIAPGQARLTEDFDLRLGDVTRGLPAGADPKRVSYQFRATDNREPNPQSALSARQYLNLNKNSMPLAQQLDAAAAKDLSAAIKQAGEQLKDAQDKLADLKKSDTGVRPSTGDARKIADAERQIAGAADSLRNAAAKSEGTHLERIGEEVRDIADRPVKDADEDLVKAGLSTDQATARRESEAAASRHAQDAQDRLAKLSDAIKQTARDQPLAGALQRLADRERKVAEALAKNPQDAKALAEQKAIQQELDKLIRDNPQLQKPVVDANQGRLNDLVKKVQQLGDAQRPINDQVNNVTAAEKSADAARDLARQQEALNREIRDFAQQQSETLKNAGTKAPDSLDNIVKELQDNKTSAATRDQNSAASTLDKAAQALQSAQKKADAAATRNKTAMEQADKDQELAKDLQKQAQDLGQKLQSPDGRGLQTPNAPVNKDAAALANQVKNAAGSITSRTTPAGKTAASDAAKLATQAATSASQGNAQKAQQELTEAANKVAQAASEEEKAATAGTMTGPQPNAAATAANKAGELADKQRDLADQTAQLSKSQEEAAAARASAATNADRQRELADRMNDAARDAQALQQQTQGAAPDLADKAGKAAQSLSQASDAQRQASQATRTLDAAGATQRQNESADKLADATEALTGARPQLRTPQQAQRPTGNSQQNNSQSGQSQNATASGSQGTQQSGNQSAGGSQGQPGAQSAQNGQAGQPGQGSRGQSTPGGQNGQSAQGAQPGQTGQTAQGAGGQTGQSAAGGQPSASRGSQPGQSGNQGGQSGSPSGNQSAQGGSPGAGQSGPQAGAANGQSASGSTPGSVGNPSQGGAGAQSGGQSAQSGGQNSGTSGNQGNSPGGIPGAGPSLGASPSGAGSPSASGNTGSGPASAAQSVQGARAAQSQALQGNPAAAGQAADQLSQAARQLAGPGQNAQAAQSGGAGQPGSGGQAGSGGQPGAAGAPGAGQAGATASGRGNGAPGAGGSGGGIGQMPNVGTGGTLEVPKEVQDVGIAPSDWVRLSPETQSQLLHSAQQAGPPGYRDMIRNYYTRIARMQGSGGTP